MIRILYLLAAGLLVCGQISCTCVNQQADETAQVMVWRAQSDLKPLDSPKVVKLTENQKGYLDFYQIKRAGKHRLGLFESGEFLLSGQLMSPDNAEKGKGTVIIVHGYFDHTGSMVNLVNHLVGEGYHVAVYDHPGHGLSDGKRASIADFGAYRAGFSDFLKVVQNQLPPPFDVVAHSMGSTVVIDYLDKNEGEGIRKTVFLAPLIKDTKSRALHLMGSVISPLRDYLIRIPEENSSNVDYKDFTAKDPLQFHCVSTRWAAALNRWRKTFDDSIPRREEPLIIYAGRDTVVDNSFGKEWLKRVFPSRKEVEIEGAGHQLLNETAPLRERTLRLISGELERED